MRRGHLIAVTAGLAASLSWALPCLAQDGALLVASFESKPPQVGEAVKGVLQYALLRTLRLPSKTSPIKTIYWQDGGAPPGSFAEAEELARVSEPPTPMALWGRAWNYGADFAVQAFLAVRDIPENRVLWRISGDQLFQQEMTVGLPSLRYEFSPLVLKNLLPVGGTPGIPTYRQRGDTVPVGTLGDRFRALRHEGEWSEVLTGDGEKRWIRVPGIGAQGAQIVAFVGGLIRARRGDWDGALALLRPLAESEETRPAIRGDAYLLMAAAAAQMKVPRTDESLRFVDRASELAPLNPSVVKYACMARLAAYFSQRDWSSKRRVIQEIRPILRQNARAFAPDDRWVGALETYLGGLEASAKVAHGN